MIVGLTGGLGCGKSFVAAALRDLGCHVLEAGGHRDMDKLIVVNCRGEQQIERAMSRPGAVESDVLARIGRQMPLQKKLSLADYVIDTSGTKEETLRQTRIVYEELRRLAS